VETAASWLKTNFDYEFANEDLLRIALTHRSVTGANNERLEFLGDSVLNFVIAEAVYEARPNAPEGILTRLRASLVNDQTLADIARDLGIGPYIILGSGELKSGGHRRESILADALEAIFGGIFLDAGFAEARLAIRQVYGDLLHEFPDEDSLKDAKTRLQEILQGQQADLPVYELLEVTGKHHEQHFRVACSVAHFGLCCEVGGPSRRKAEQAAATLMLDAIDARQDR
jgi:ribonuclease-3